MFIVCRTIASAMYHHSLDIPYFERPYMNGTFRDLLLVDIYCIYTTGTIDTAGQVLALAVALYALSRVIVLTRRCSDPFTDVLELCTYTLATMAHLIMIPSL